MENSHYIGIMAGVLTTSSALPQAFKIWRTSSTNDISFLWSLMLTVGCILWCAHGYIQDDEVLMFANALTILLNAYILLRKWHNETFEEVLVYTRNKVNEGDN